MSTRAKWLLFSVSGLILVGAGLSLFGEALMQKTNEKPFWHWFAWGTFSLIVFNSGLSLFGQGVVYRSRLK